MPLPSNIPYGELWTTLKTAAKYMAPAAPHMVAGAVAGGTAGYMGGNGHTMRDAAIGAIGGLGLSGMGRSYGKSFFRGATQKNGVFDLAAGGAAIRSRAVGRWNGIGRLAK